MVRKELVCSLLEPKCNRESLGMYFSTDSLHPLWKETGQEAAKSGHLSSVMTTAELWKIPCGGE